MVYFLVFLTAINMAGAIRAVLCDQEILSKLASTARAARALSQKTMADSRLEELGGAYTAGLDILDDMFKAAESLRTDPDAKIASEIFRVLIDRHLAVVESGIRSQRGPKSVAERLKILDAFKEEIGERVESGRVDYRWWANLNYRLSVLATPYINRLRDGNDVKAKKFITYIHTSGGRWLTDEGVEDAYDQTGDDFNSLGSYLNRFPELVAWPTARELGVMVFNRTFMTGIHPIGVVGDVVNADGRQMQPDVFFLHDLAHWYFIRMHWESPEESVRKGQWHKKTWIDTRERASHFHLAFLRRVEGLRGRERKMAELVYFILTHEFPSRVLGAVDGEGLFIDGTRVGSDLLPDDVDGRSYKEVRKFLSESEEYFRLLASEINGDLAEMPPSTSN